MEAADDFWIAKPCASVCPAADAAAGAVTSPWPGAGELRQQLDAAQKMNDANRCILEAAGDGIYGIDGAGVTTFANPAAEAMTGWLPGELIGKPQHKCIHHSHADGSHYPAEICPIYMAVQDGHVHRSDSEVFWRKDGTSFPVSYMSTPILRENKPVGAVVIFQDITKRKRREAWEKAKNAIFLAITTHEPLEVTLAMVTAAFVELQPSCAAAVMIRQGDLLHLAAEAAVPVGMRQILAAMKTNDSTLACARAAELGIAILTSTRSGGSGARTCREIYGSGFSTCVSSPILSATGDVLGVFSFFDENDDLNALQELVTSHGVCDLARLAIEHQFLHLELLRQSQHDHLTGLPNRMLLEDRLERSIMHARRHGTHVAVCYLDLDHFKQINDSLGHSAGDAVLCHVAKLLRQNLKEIDTVARQGGDEFILILSDLKTEAEADQVCERILDELRTPMVTGKHTITPAASMGRSFYPANGQTATALLQNADLALYKAKCSGRDRMQHYSATMGERVQREIELQRELRYAIDRNQLRVVYQPLYSTGRLLVGFEALLRWFHPAFGEVEPSVFIPLAEKTGLILSIGEWVLQAACREAKHWNTISTSAIKIFVNVSGVQLGEEDFVDTVRQELGRSGLRANLLELEITETAIVSDPAAASLRLNQLRELGIRISIDDFGCGHSTFSYLQQLPIDTIKIDRSFIACLDGTEKKSAIIRTIVALAEELGLETVAEGVETGSQLVELQGTNCGLVQGYLLSKPLTPSAAMLLIPGDHVEVIPHGVSLPLSHSA